MENNPKDLKAKLRFLTIENIFKIPFHEPFPSFISDLIVSLFQYDEAIETVLQLIQQQQNIIVLIDILKLLYSHFQSAEKIVLNQEFSTKVLRSILNCLERNAIPTNSSSKNDGQIMLLIFQASHVSSLMSQYLPDLLHPMPTNSYILTYLLITTSLSSNDDDLLPFVEPFYTPKLTLSPCSYGTIFMMSTHKDLDDVPSLKSLIGFFKSISDKVLFQLLTPIVLRAIILRLSPSALKEIPTLISFLPAKLRHDSENVPLFSYFIDKVLELPDALNVIKPYYEQIFKLYVHNIQSNIPFDEEIEDPSKHIKSSIGSAFCLLMDSCSINPFESFLISMLESKTDNVILLTIYIINHTTSVNFTSSSFDQIINALKQYIDKSSTTNQLFMHLCGNIIEHFESKTALTALIQGLENNSELASKILKNQSLNFAFVFSNIARSLKPGQSSPLLISTLREILQNQVPQPDFSIPLSDTDSRSCSDSTNFDLPDFDRISTVLPDSAIETAPTDATVLFCSLLVSLEQFPDLFSLIPYSASAISPSFSAALMRDFPNPNSHKFSVKVLSALGNALQCLDITDIYSLTQTFLMLLPGQAMLLLAITLQRLPRSIIITSLTKTVPFVLPNPDETGRMVALISYSHPDIAMDFIESIISSSTLRKRSFFTFRASESNELALIVIFKIIGYCSVFLDIGFFSSTFMNFSTQFLNKYLTHQSKSANLYSASLFAIRKLSYRVQIWQEEHLEHVFPFKDFLVQYVCAYFLDLGDNILHSHSSDTNDTLLKNIPRVLTTLSSLLPLRPIRPYDRHERSVELTAVMVQVANDQHFNSIFHASENFFSTLLDCNPSVNVFIMIVMPIAPALLIHSEWIQFCHIMEFLCVKWTQLNIQQSSDVLSKIISNIALLISYVIPLTLQPEAKDISVNIIFSLVSLQCSIRNHILSLPQSIRPTKPETENKSAKEVNASICDFLAKHFTTSQTFDVIMSLIGFYERTELLKIHHYSVAECIKRLLQDRGSEEFRFDGKIVQSLVDASNDKDDAVISSFIAIFEVLLKMRLFSMISNIIPLNQKLNDTIFAGILKAVLDIENGGKQLLNVIATFFTNEEQENAVEFSYRALPLLAGSMKFIENDNWTKIFLGITNRDDINELQINHPLIKSLVGNEEYEDFFGFAKIVARDRILALQVLLLSFPENPNDFFIKLAVAFASTSVETCEAFLNYAVSAMLRKSTCFSCYLMMQTIFENVDNQYWIGLSESLTALFIQNMRYNDDVVDCTITFLNNISGVELKEFWENFVEICGANIEKWIIIIKRISLEGKVHTKSLSYLLPELIVHLENDEFKDTIFAFASKLNENQNFTEGSQQGTGYCPQNVCSHDEIKNDIEKDFEKSSHNIFDTCYMIMKADEFKDSTNFFLKSFVSYIEEKKYVKICSRMIIKLCDELTEDNLFALNSLIEHIGLFEEDDDIIDILMRLLQ
ncbi:hypothetical protein TRFO_07944 [Tritrichomonas foetus]|uniref:Uncharacterized protein n=1 Tax=Tritrichomonas foetus TaxID=1144522 RepID=A0A1J4JRZ0_9EUKA|nr:hypothetical protein TRFO_07944 [Tritrichomonas foetus]|eukprot:OHT00294.1 hypothetical protein TRFO_07944 [Tritrichomonas foetus]